MKLYVVISNYGDPVGVYSEFTNAEERAHMYSQLSDTIEAKVWEIPLDSTQAKEVYRTGPSDEEIAADALRLWDQMDRIGRTL